MSSRVIAAVLPDTSLLQDRVTTDDFLDCYSVKSSLDPRTAASIITSFPGWVSLLMSARNALVKPFGLAAETPDNADKIGPFPIEYESDVEIVAGFNDKHLNFRVSVMAQNNHVYMATWVHPHNIGGRLYLATIMPFHIIIVRNALQRVADFGENEAN